MLEVALQNDFVNYTKIQEEKAKKEAVPSFKLSKDFLSGNHDPNVELLLFNINLKQKKLEQSNFVIRQFRKMQLIVNRIFDGFNFTKQDPIALKATMVSLIHLAKKNFKEYFVVQNRILEFPGSDKCALRKIEQKDEDKDIFADLKTRALNIQEQIKELNFEQQNTISGIHKIISEANKLSAIQEITPEELNAKLSPLKVRLAEMSQKKVDLIDKQSDLEIQVQKLPTHTFDKTWFDTLFKKH